MILLVDDDPMFLDQADRDLTAAGYRVLQANHAALALSAVELLANELTLAIIDLDLPDMSGFDLIRELRMRAPHMKIVAISGVCLTHTLEVAKYLGAQLALQKPMHSDWVEEIKTVER